MSRFTPHHGRGMTLVELLVVVAILGLLAVTVLPALGTGAERGRTKSAAAAVSSLMSLAHSTALGRKEWLGFTVTPTGPTSLTAVEICLATMQPPYCGDSLNAKLALQSGTTAVRIALPESACPTINATPNPSPPELLGALTLGGTTGDLIQFGGSGPLYELTLVSTGSLAFQMRSEAGMDDAGQSSETTPWPAETPAAHTFEIFRQPIPRSERLSIPDGRAVDLSWSGYNDKGNYIRFNNPGQPVSLLFDGSGRVRQVLAGSTRIALPGTVYFLVGRSDRVGQGYGPLNVDDDSVGANWQYADSVWLAIDPLTGTVRVAESRPNATTVVDSQDYIRNRLF